jgi:hypothetical protein
MPSDNVFAAYPLSDMSVLEPSWPRVSVGGVWVWGQLHARISVRAQGGGPPRELGA